MPHNYVYIPDEGVPPSDTGVYDAIKYMLNALKAEIQEFGWDSIEVQDTLQKLEEHFREYLPFVPRSPGEVYQLDNYIGNKIRGKSNFEFNWVWIVIIILLVVIVFLLVK